MAEIGAMGSSADLPESVLAELRIIRDPGASPSSCRNWRRSARRWWPRKRHRGNFDAQGGTHEDGSL